MNPRTKKRPGLARWAQLGLTALALAACEPSPGERLTGPDLEHVDIPEDFTFSTQQAVALSVEGALERSATMLQVDLPSGDTLYRGPVGPEPTLRLPVAAAVGHLVVHLEGPGLDETREVPVEGGRAVLRR
jgi:hypothetical protein